MVEQVTIGSRFRGPAESGNGGYSCGVLAHFLEPAPTQVTLRLPPPLERPLAVEVHETGATMRDDDAVVAEAERVDGISLEVPDPVGVEEATAARAGSPLRHEHPFPGCFVCGPDRCDGDGLCVTCGPVDGAQVVAAPWHVDDSLPLEGGVVAPELVWSVLDCPGGIAGMLVPGVGTCVLGRLAAAIDGAIEPGMTCVAIGWPIERDGRKLSAGSAIFSERGELLARGLATWIELKR